MDTWASGEKYEQYVGRWSRLVAGQFLAWLDVPPRSNWLDVGCGTGVLTEAILHDMRPASVTGLDASSGFLAHAVERIRDDRVSFRTGDAIDLPFARESFDATVSGLALNFFSRPATAVAEMARVTRPQGVVALYVWDYAGEMQMMRAFWDAVVELEGSDERDEGRRFPICQPDPLAELFERTGLAEVAVRAVEITTRFRDFDDYWQPFTGGQGAAPGYLATLPDHRKAEMRELTRSKLRFEPDGSLALPARAWAARGRR